MKKIFVLILILFCSSPVLAKQKLDKPPTSPSSGYVGTLPNLDNGVQKPEPKESAPIFESVDGFNNQSQLKPAPRQDPAFVNIILKKDKTSQYVNDVNTIIPIVEKLEKYIEDKSDIQKFNAEAYFLRVNVEFMRDKYQNKSEGSYTSFKKLMELNLHVQTVSQLRAEKEIYSPYMAYSGNGAIYNSNNIDRQLEYLLKEIHDTLIVLKETN